MAEPASTSEWLRRQEGADRATSAVVGKTVEAALVVLFVGLLTATLHAGLAPAYERAAGEEVADRVLVAASEEIERAAPPDRHGTERHGLTLQRRVDLPPRIASGNYRILADGTSLRLEQPGTEIERTTDLAVPGSVRDVTGSWQSGAETVLVIEAEGSEENGDEDYETVGVTIRLENR